VDEESVELVYVVLDSVVDGVVLDCEVVDVVEDSVLVDKV
jgi:hypothetical protein